jgi:hypothetical protein
MYEGVTYADLGYGTDVAPSTLLLGEGWGELERDGFSLFRRVAAEAAALLAGTAVVYEVSIDLEPAESGPEFEVACCVDGRACGEKRIRGRSMIRFRVPPSEPAMRPLTLSVGRPVRIFRFAALPYPRDVVPYWRGFRVGRGGWYPLEGSPPDMFRWVNREAEIVVERPERSLELDIEPGPSAPGARVQVDVLIGEGELVRGFALEGRTRITVELPALRCVPERLLLRSSGGSVPAPPDARTLDFRVFAIPAPWERSELLRSLAALAPR